MKKQILANIPRGLYGLFCLRLLDVEKKLHTSSGENFIPASYIYEKLCRNFSLKKQEVREILFFLRDMNLLEISQMRVKINFEIGDDNEIS